MIWKASDLQWKQDESGTENPGPDSQIEAKLRKIEIEIVHRYDERVNGEDKEFVVVQDAGKVLGDGDWIIASPLPNPMDGVTVELVGQGRESAAQQLLQQNNEASARTLSSRVNSLGAVEQ